MPSWRRRRERGRVAEPRPAAGPAAGADPAASVVRAERLVGRLHATGVIEAGASVTACEVRRNPNSVVARITLGGRATGRALYAKWLLPDEPDGRASRADRPYKEAQVRLEYETLRRVGETLAGHPRCGVIRVLACFPDDLCLVSEESAGEKLAAELRAARWYAPARAIERLSGLCRACGEWLRVFQDCLEPPGPASYDPEEELAYCRVRLELLEVRGRLRASLSGEILRRLEADAAAIRHAAPEIRGRHNDFGPLNILVSGERVTVLDVAGFGYGPREWDVCKFWSILEMLRYGPFYSGRAVDRLQAAFLAGYGGRVDFSGPVWRLARAAFVLDKMGDVLLDWGTLRLLERPLYLALYLRYRRWLEEPWG